jgi:serine/threonine protein kinase
MGGSLTDFVHASLSSTPTTVAAIAYRLLKGVHYLHSQHILHGDIKPGNIVLRTQSTDDPHPLIIDFGHATDLSGCGVCQCRLMTCAYSAPELLGLNDHSLPSDIWSVAATVHFMVTKSDLLHITHLAVMRDEALNLRLVCDGEVWQRYPESFPPLLRAMLRPEPERRPNAQECLAHPFFRDLLGAEWIAKEDGAAPPPPNQKGTVGSGGCSRTASGGDNAHR